MPLSRDEAQALAELVCVIRPTWNLRGVMTAGMIPLAKHPAPLEVIVWACVRGARDTEHIHTPGALPLNGPHWNLADRPATPRLTAENECRIHVGKWAGSCPECAAEAKGKQTDAELDHELQRELGGQPLADPKQLARDAIKRSQADAHDGTDQ